MNKYLLIASLFFCSNFSANEEVVTTEPTTEVTETITTEIENSSNLESDSTSIVFDFVMELESLTEDWTDLINSTRTLITRCQNLEEENNLEAALHVAQAVYAHAVSAENNAHGNLCISLYETDSNDVTSTIESAAPHYIAFRLVVARNNDSNSALWTTFQNMVQTVLATLQATQSAATQIAQAAELVQEEIQEIEEVVENVQAAMQDNDSTNQENFVVTISNAVQELFTLIKEDNNKSFSTRLYISAATNNTAE